MLALPYDLRRSMLVRSATDTTALILLQFVAGQTVDVALAALFPTGDSSAPYAPQTITAATLTLSRGRGVAAVPLVMVGTFFDGWQAALTLPTSGVVPAGQEFADGVLVADITTTTGGPYHIETWIVLRDPSAPIAPPVSANYPPVDDLARVDDPSLVFGYADYSAMAAAAVDGPITGVVPTQANQAFFSTYDPAGQVFVRNSGALFAWPSWASVWNSANADGTGGNRGCIVLVTPTEGLTNHHFAQPYQPGVAHTFLGRDGQQYVLTVASSQQYAATDLQVVKFTTAAPSTVGVATALTAAQTTAVLAAGAPVISSAQDHLARINEFVSDGGGFVTLQPATTAARAAWTRAPITVLGDSDQPSWIILDGQPVVLTTWSSTAGQGPSIAGALAQINAMLTGGSVQTPALNLLPAASATGVQLGQDLGGTNSAPTVVGIQGREVSPTAPTMGQGYFWDGTQLSPQSPGPASVADADIVPRNVNTRSVTTNQVTAPGLGASATGSGSSTYGYRLVALFGSQHTQAGAEVTVSSAPDTLGSGAYVTAYWSHVTGAGYILYRTTAPGNSSTGRIAVINPPAATAPGATISFTDIGTPASAIPPITNYATNTTGQITAQGGFVGDISQTTVPFAGIFRSPGAGQALVPATGTDVAALLPPALLARGRIASYRFDEGVGTLAENEAAPASALTDGELTANTIGGIALPWSMAGITTSGSISFAPVNGNDLTGSLASRTLSQLSVYFAGTAAVGTNTGACGIFGDDNGTGFSLQASSGYFRFTFGGSAIYNVLTTPSDGRPHVWSATYDGTTLRGYCDGVEMASAAASISPVTLTTLRMGTLNADHSYAFGATYHAASLYGVAHTPAQVRAQTKAYGAMLNARGVGYVPLPAAVFIDGDSNFTGISGVIPWINVAVPSLTPITQARSFAMASSTVINGAAPPGNDLVTRAPLLKAAFANLALTGGKVVVAVESGTNDFADSSLSAAQFVANLKAYCLDLIAAGANRLIVVTPLATTRTDNGGGTVQAKIDAATALILADHSFYWAVVNTQTDPAIGADGAAGPAGSGSATTYFLDGTHLNNAGQVRWNALIQPKVQAALSN